MSLFCIRKIQKVVPLSFIGTAKYASCTTLTILVGIYAIKKHTHTKGVSKKFIHSRAWDGSLVAKSVSLACARI